VTLSRYSNGAACVRTRSELTEGWWAFGPSKRRPYRFAARRSGGFDECRRPCPASYGRTQPPCPVCPYARRDHAADSCRRMLRARCPTVPDPSRKPGRMSTANASHWFRPAAACLPSRSCVGICDGQRQFPRVTYTIVRAGREWS
jgi:hypothetical protein